MSCAFYGCCELFLVLETDPCVFAALDGVEVVQKVLQKRSIFIINRIYFFFAEEAFFALKDCHEKESKRKINCRELHRARRQDDDDQEQRYPPLVFLEQQEAQNPHDEDGVEHAFLLVFLTLAFREDFPDSM